MMVFKDEINRGGKTCLEVGPHRPCFEGLGWIKREKGEIHLRARILLYLLSGSHRCEQAASHFCHWSQGPLLPPGLPDTMGRPLSCESEQTVPSSSCSLSGVCSHHWEGSGTNTRQLPWRTRVVLLHGHAVLKPLDSSFPTAYVPFHAAITKVLNILRPARGCSIAHFIWFQLL